jgi:hypothetical protein
LLSEKWERISAFVPEVSGTFHAHFTTLCTAGYELWLINRFLHALIWLNLSSEQMYLFNVQFSKNFSWNFLY